MAPSSTDSSMKRRMCGSVTETNVRNVLAPSTAAASSTSLLWLCSPASSSSIMNGVHCQTSAETMEIVGYCEIQSVSPAPNGPSTQLMMPNSGSNIVVFHSSAPATGIT